MRTRLPAQSRPRIISRLEGDGEGTPDATRKSAPRVASLLGFGTRGVTRRGPRRAPRNVAAR
eukprot:7401114-Pyramimonas_sp.AAC.1